MSLLVPAPRVCEHMQREHDISTQQEPVFECLVFPAAEVPWACERVRRAEVPEAQRKHWTLRHNDLISASVALSESSKTLVQEHRKVFHQYLPLVRVPPFVLRPFLHATEHRLSLFIRSVWFVMLIPDLKYWAAHNAYQRQFPSFLLLKYELQALPSTSLQWYDCIIYIEIWTLFDGVLNVVRQYVYILTKHLHQHYISGAKMIKHQFMCQKYTFLYE